MKHGALISLFPRIITFLWMPSFVIRPLGWPGDVFFTFQSHHLLQKATHCATCTRPNLWIRSRWSVRAHQQLFILKYRV
jgi:hypothetical protein